ncbi:MAG: alpha/beta fold hydrolase [Hyphomicrobiaceae bacterium]
MALIQYTRVGSGRPPLLFVHGFGCARSDWDAMVAHFRDRHETVAVDLGAHGTTPGTQEHRRIETHGADVAELLTELDMPPAVIFGHSMGCRVAMDAALRVPKRIKAVVLVDGSRLGETGSTSYLKRSQALEEAGYQPFIRSAFEAMFSPGFDKAKSDPVVQRALDRDASICGPLFGDIGRYDAENLERVVGAVKVPMLAIQTTLTNSEGKRVSMKAGQTSDYLEFLKRTKPGVKVEVIPDIGHFPQLERPDETNAIIERFLKDLPQ